MTKQKMDSLNFVKDSIGEHTFFCMDPKQAATFSRDIISGDYKEFSVEVTANDGGELLFHFFPPTGRRFNVKFKKSMEKVFISLMPNFPDRVIFGKAEGVQKKGNLVDVDSYYTVLKGLALETMFQNQDEFQRYVINPLEEIRDSFKNG